MSKYELMRTPNWIIETIACLIEGTSDADQEIITNSEKFGMTRDEMENFLKPLINYKKSVLKELMPIASKYKRLMKYTQKTEIEEEALSELLLLVSKYSSRILVEETKDSIDDIFNQHFTTIVNEYMPKSNGEESIVSNIMDIINNFSNMNLDSDFKMKMIEFYNERYEVWSELKEFITESQGICEKYFYIIQKEFNEAVKQLEDLNQLEELIHKSEVLSLQIGKITKVIPFIFCFNVLSIHDVNEEDYNCYIGIYTLQLIERKKNNRMNDKHLIADLKAIGDDTRLRILRLLTEQKMYIQELADVLNLTPATVSHHINILLQSRVISISMDTDKMKKITYEVNAARLEELGEAIKNLARDIVTKE